MIPYLIKSFRGGVSDETDKGIKGSFKHGYALDIHKRADSLSCSQAMVQIDGGTVPTLINFFIPSTDGTVYAFGATGSIYARSGDGAWAGAYNDENGAILGASEWTLNDGVRYLYWATATSLARAAIQGSVAVPWAAGVATQDYKTDLTLADWHTMKPAGGSLLIANAENLAEVAYDGSYDADALNIRPGNLLNTLDEVDDEVILGSETTTGSEEGYLWKLDLATTNLSQKKRIPVKGINALINTELLLAQGGSNGELFYSDFVNAVPLVAVPGGGQVNPGGVSIEDDIAIFGMYGGTYPGLWSYGRRRKNRSLALNYNYRLSGTVNGSSVSTIGAVLMVNDELLASWGISDGSTSTYGVDSTTSTTKASALYEGLEFDGGTPHLKKTVENINLTMTAMGSGVSVAAKFKLDGETDWRYAVTGAGETTYGLEGSTEALFNLGKPGNVYEVGVELTPSENHGPEVLAVTSYLADETYTHG